MKKKQEKSMSVKNAMYINGQNRMSTIQDNHGMHVIT